MWSSNSSSLLQIKGSNSTPVILQQRKNGSSLQVYFITLSSSWYDWNAVKRGVQSQIQSITECCPVTDDDDNVDGIRFKTIIWAASWQNQQNDCAPSEDSDQPGHPPSLIRWMDGWVRVLRPFNSISVISRWWKGKHERLCAMKRCLGSGRISPPVGFEPATRSRER